MNASDHVNHLAFEMRANSERWFPKWHDGTLPLPIAYALGLAGEVGEVCNVVKKMHRDGHHDGEGLGAELADCLTYLLLLADEVGVDIVDEYYRKAQVNEARWGCGQPPTEAALSARNDPPRETS